MAMDLKQFLTILQVYGPGVLAVAVPQLAPYIGPVISAVGHAQQIKGATNEVKKAHVMGISEAAVAAANASGHAHLDPAATLAAVSSGVDTLIATIHAVEAAHNVDPTLL